jgi:ribosomal protein S18 acetylase RimI-like enzyme
MTVLNLDVRESQDAAIGLYESLDYRRWGTNPHYAWVGQRWVAGHFYAKDLSRAAAETA